MQWLAEIMKPAEIPRNVARDLGFAIKTDAESLSLVLDLQRHPQSNLWSLSLDIMCPALWRALGNDLEAKVGIPIASYTVSCHSEALGRGGVIFNPESPELFATYISECISEYFGPCIIASRDVPSFVAYSREHPYILGRSAAKCDEVLAKWTSALDDE